MKNYQSKGEENKMNHPIHGSNNIINTPHRINIKNPKYHVPIYRQPSTAHARAILFPPKDD